MLHIKPAAAPAEHRDEPTKIFIPDTLARWPWPRRINPHYAAVVEDSTAWIKSFGALSPKAQHAFDRCNSVSRLGLVPGRVYSAHVL